MGRCIPLHFWSVRYLDEVKLKLKDIESSTQEAHMVIWRDACGGDVEDSMSELEKP